MKRGRGRECIVKTKIRYVSSKDSTEYNLRENSFDAASRYRNKVFQVKKVEKM